MKDFIRELPKAELHLHIEGSFEPELMFEIAKRNGISIPYSTVEEVKEAYEFNNLQEFLDIYYQGAKVLQTEEDFYDLAMAYYRKAKEENIVHSEIFFDPQTHTDRGIPFDTVIKGIHKAMEEARNELGLSTSLIMCFLRHLSEEAAIKTLEEALPYKDWIIGVGLDSSELGNPPAKFERVFKKAKEEGFKLVAHAGEEGPADYIWDSLNILNIDRLDHGNRCLDDEGLVKELVEKQIALTLCPLSNLKLKVVEDMGCYPIVKMMDMGLLVTINSDDPAYFGGYLNRNYEVLADSLGLGEAELRSLAINSFKASFLSEEKKQAFIERCSA
jgi:adenine deaminase